MNDQSEELVREKEIEPATELSMLKQGLDPAVKGFRANYHLSKPEEQAQATSLEGVTLLKVSEVWDRIMFDPLKFKLKQERAPRSFKN